MSRTVLAVALSAVVSAALTASLVLPTASAEGTKVVCTQVPQGLPPRPSQVDDQFVANFMSEQLAAGRERFQTVQGMSTVLCAW
jgi:hypothetical protein